MVEDKRLALLLCGGEKDDKISNAPRSCFLQLGTLSTLSADVSSVIKGDFDASVDASVSHLVTGWVPLMDSSLKDSVIINATANASYEQVEVGQGSRVKRDELRNSNVCKLEWYSSVAVAADCADLRCLRSLK